ncbi:Ankyrin-3 [Nymphaea thermarum]|nr:Ankyrin-3 [Nymphaea thermarum]
MGGSKRNSNSGGRKASDSGDNLHGGIHTAAREGNMPVLEEICNYNPLAINSRDKHSRTPLHLAAWSGQTEVVSFLCNLKADVGAAAIDDMGAIHFGSQKGHLEIVRILVSSGASVSARTRKGFTPLHYAVQGSHLDLVKYLLKKGASLTAKTKAGKLPLDVASNEEIKKILMDYEEATKKKEETNGCEKAEDKAIAEQASVHEISAGDEEEERTNERDEDQEDRTVESNKRSIAEAKIEENVAEPKRHKVALKHLLASDDIEEEE